MNIFSLSSILYLFYVRKHSKQVANRRECLTAGGGEGCKKGGRGGAVHEIRGKARNIQKTEGGGGRVHRVHARGPFHMHRGGGGNYKKN